MNKERYNQIIDDAYNNFFLKKMSHTEDEFWIVSREQFINRIKTDETFSEKWGLKIEERELSEKERIELIQPFGMDALIPDIREKWMKENNIPTKLITITYNNETIKKYE